MTCPACRLENPPSAQRCDCGYDFVTHEMPASRPRVRNLIAKLGGMVALSTCIAFAVFLRASSPEGTLRRHRSEWEDSAKRAFAAGRVRSVEQRVGDLTLRVDIGPPRLAALSEEGNGRFLYDPDQQLAVVTELPYNDPRAAGFRALYGRDLRSCEPLDPHWYYCEIT